MRSSRIVLIVVGVLMTVVGAAMVVGGAPQRRRLEPTAVGG